MDKKGFLIGKLQKVKRVISKDAFKHGRLISAGQDGSREWITLIAAICMDGTRLPPALIYKADSGLLQDNWVKDVNPDDCSFFTSSPNGWTSDVLGYKWLTEVFDRCTKEKARRGRDPRLLIVDGHGSHINMRFLDWCEQNGVMVAVFPPHTTHRLQPFDVSLFIICFNRGLLGIFASRRSHRVFSLHSTDSTKNTAELFK